MTLAEALNDGNPVYSLPTSQGVTMKDKFQPKSNLSLQLELANQQQSQELRGRELPQFHGAPQSGLPQLNKATLNYTTTHIKRELNLLSPTKEFHNNHILESEAESNHVILRRLYENDGTRGGPLPVETLPGTAVRPSLTLRDRVFDAKSTIGRNRKDGIEHQQPLSRRSVAVKQTYLNETAFLQALEQKQRVQQQLAASSAFSKGKQNYDKDTASKNRIGTSVNITNNCNNVSLLSSSPPTTQPSLSRNMSPFLRRSKLRRQRRGSPPPSLSSSIGNTVRPSSESPPPDEAEAFSQAQDLKIATNYGDMLTTLGTPCHDTHHNLNPLNNASDQGLCPAPHTSALFSEQQNLYATQNHLRSSGMSSTHPRDAIPPTYSHPVHEQTFPLQVPNTSNSRNTQEEPQQEQVQSQQPQPIDHIKNFAVSLGLHSLFGTKPSNIEPIGQEENNFEALKDNYRGPSEVVNESNNAELILQQDCLCQNCSNLGAQLDVALADIEYLKGMLQLEEENKRQEAVIKSISSVPSRQEDNLTQNNNPVYPNKQYRGLKSSNSSQLQEVTTRHKKQMEQVMKDTLRLQLEMRSKQLKLTDLCRGLNDESVKRKSDAELLQESVMELQNERDDLAMENLRLRAALEARQKEIAKLEEIRDKYVQNEHNEVQRASDVIDERDQTIEALTARLSIALDRIDQYEYEKQQQQRKKKQFFFPFPLSAPVSPR